ncbi:MAG TPA: hypothetical protein VLG15_12355 [Thermoanaerobaculia bacterium]|nr:hypothetical protein [Thermoanaerobaculia bacterium]
MAHLSACSGPQGFAQLPRLWCGAYLPASLASAAAGERDRDQDHDCFHSLFTSFRSVQGFSHRHCFIVDFGELPASLAATATSERHRDQDQGQFQHCAPHRLEGLGSLCSPLRAADGDWLEHPSCHVQCDDVQTLKATVPEQLGELRIALPARGEIGGNRNRLATVLKRGDNSMKFSKMGE